MLFYLNVFIFSLYTKVLFAVFKCNSGNDSITVIALLLISIILTLFFVFVRAKLSRSPFKLSLPTKLFLLSKVFLIICIIISNGLDIHKDFLACILDYWFNYIYPVFLGNELLALGMSGPTRKFIHYTGGGNHGTGNGNGNGRAPDRPGTLAPVPDHTEFYTCIPNPDNPNNPNFNINDPDFLVNSTNGRYDPRVNYGNNIFFRNAAVFLSNRRDFGSFHMPPGLDPVQLRFLQDMREHHYNHAQFPDRVRQFDPSRNSYNTQDFIR
jgi:hypothetical protein